MLSSSTKIIGLSTTKYQSTTEFDMLAKCVELPLWPYMVTLHFALIPHLVRFQWDDSTQSKYKRIYILHV